MPLTDKQVTALGLHNGLVRVSGTQLSAGQFSYSPHWATGPQHASSSALNTHSILWVPWHSRCSEPLSCCMSHCCQWPAKMQPRSWALFPDWLASWPPGNVLLLPVVLYNMAKAIFKTSSQPLARVTALVGRKIWIPEWSCIIFLTPIWFKHHE